LLVSNSLSWVQWAWAGQQDEAPYTVLVLFYFLWCCV